MTQERNDSGGRGGGASALLARPLGPRSLIGSLLLGMSPPRMPGARLVEWCGLFGVAEGTARVALSRMADRGELTASDGVYELAGHLRRRQPAQDWSLAPELETATGGWRLAVVRPGPRTAAERSALREAGRHLRVAEVREGVWTRPDNLPRAAAPAEWWRTADAQCDLWTARPAADPVELAAELFAPATWAERARMLLARLVVATDGVSGAPAAALADAFVVGAATLAHVRADPLLPADLCGDAWPGDELRAAYREYRRAFSGAVREWFRAR